MVWFVVEKKIRKRGGEIFTWQLGVVSSVRENVATIFYEEDTNGLMAYDEKARREVAVFSDRVRKLRVRG